MHIEKTIRWLLGCMLVALAMAIAIRLGFGPGERMNTALQATARRSFVLFWLATAGAP